MSWRVPFVLVVLVALVACSRHPAGVTVERCAKNENPQSCYAFFELARMTPQEKARFQKRHDCGHNLEWFATDCLEEAQGAKRDEEILVKTLQHLVSNWETYSPRFGSNKEQASALLDDLRAKLDNLEPEVHVFLDCRKEESLLECEALRLRMELEELRAKGVHCVTKKGCLEWVRR